MKTSITINRHFFGNKMSLCFMLLFFVNFNIPNFIRWQKLWQVQCLDANVTFNEVCIDTRLCGIYGGGAPDKIIGSDINSEEEISDYYTPDGNGVVTPTTGHLILIQGTLKIDKHFRGNNLRFKMGDGAKIIIENSKSFYAANCKFFSCNEMWRGIEAPYAKSISLISCFIEDAEYAFSVGPNTGIGLLNNDLTLNFVGFKNLGDQLKIGACLGNSFRGIEDLDMRPHYNSDQEILDHYDAGTPYAGFLLTNCVTTIGRSNSSSSFTFSRVVHGAKIINTNMTMQGATFNLIYGTELDEFLSSGIYAEGSNLTSKKNNFTDNFYAGIYAHSTRLDVQYCIFTDCCNGILSEYNVLGEKIDIIGNVFNMNSPSFQVNKSSNETYPNYGILLSRSAGSPGLINTIHDNKFYIGNDNTNAFSAHVSETSVSYGGEEIQFRGNRSNITSTEDMVCGYKIRCYNSNFIEIDQDSFYFINNSLLTMRNGVTAQSLGRGHKVTNNRFESGTNRTMNIGFEGAEFTNVYYCDNYFKNPRESFYFLGNCDRSSLATSTFDNAFRGVYIRNHRTEKGRIGVQDRRGNEWDCTIPISSWAAVNEASVPSDSKFWIETSNCIRYPTTGIDPPDWFELSVNTVANDCSAPSLADSCGNILGFSLYDWKIINGEYPEGSSQALIEFNADYRLLERLILNPGLLNCDTSAQNYWENHNESTAAQLASLLTEIRMAIQIPDSIQEQLDDISEEENEALYSIDTLFENHNWQDSLGLDSLFQNSLGEFLEALQLLNETKDSLYAEIEEMRTEQLDELEDENAGISTDSIWETNLKTMNTFIIHLLIGTADSTDYANVEAIAQQDFGEGGPAVLHARVWFEGEDSEESLRKSKTQKIESMGDTDLLDKSKSDLAFVVCPNPVDVDQVNVISNVEMLNGYLYDLDGRMTKNLQPKSKKKIAIDVTTLRPGIYILGVELIDGRYMTERICIL